jgi:hypothetical protein
MNVLFFSPLVILKKIEIKFIGLVEACILYNVWTYSCSMSVLRNILNYEVSFKYTKWHSLLITYRRAGIIDFIEGCVDTII